MEGGLHGFTRERKTKRKREEREIEEKREKQNFLSLKFTFF